jgi:hypothetical protein
MSRLRVQHWIACLESHVEPPAGPRNFYNLFRVGYTHTALTDTEFPWLATTTRHVRQICGRN